MAEAPTAEPVVEEPAADVAATAQAVTDVAATPSPSQDELPDEIRRILEGIGSQDPSVKMQSLHELSKLGPALGVLGSALTSCLVSGPEKMRVGAAMALGGGGSKSKQAIEALVRALGDEDRELSNAATEALVNMGLPAVPELSLALKDASINIEAMMVLGKIGSPAAKGAVPALEETLDDLSPGHSPLKFMAAAALAQAGGPKNPCWQKAVAVLETGIRGDSCMEAMGALRFVPTSAAVPALIASLGAEDDGRRSAAMEALVGIGKEAVPLLVQAMEASADADVGLFTATSSVLAQLGRFSEEAVPMLMQKVMSGPDRQRCAALRALAEVGEGARPALPLIAHMAGDEDLAQEVRNCAADAVRKIDS